MQRRSGILLLARGAAGCAALMLLACWIAAAPKEKTPPSPPPPDPITFQDVARKAGVDFVLRNSATPQKHQVETMVSGVAVLDYDGDGWPDIYFINGAHQPKLEKDDPSFYNRLYRNNRDGTFRDVTQKAGVKGEGFATGVAAADYDNDGWTDLFIAGVNRNILYRNRGDGTFEDVTKRAGLSSEPGAAKPWSIAAGWFDYDGDGLLDLFVVNYCVWDPAKEPPCVIDGFRVYCHPDYYSGLPNNLYHNNGDGTFTDVSEASGIGSHVGKGMGVAFLDYDQDGRIDVFVGNDTLPNFLFHNEGKGRFKEKALQAGVAFDENGRAVSSMGVEAGDIDNDGREDLFIAAMDSETFPLFRNLGKGLFQDITFPSGLARQSLDSTGWGNGIRDFNNDGRKDLFVACSSIDDNAEKFSGRKSREPNKVLVNLGGRRFLDVSASAGTDFRQAGAHRGVAFGDFDRDGRVDAVVSRIGERAELFRNTSANGNHYLAVRLKGRRSNRDGIGALIHLVGLSGREQWSRISTSTGYGCSSDRTAFFGLGGDAKARLLEVVWPSGTRQKAEDVLADRYLTLEEPGDEGPKK
jgi:enediyne biosynthesis protein E4